ncbi:uncharacterized protein METZ01_LOCUS63221, partial [marine metagenome]
VKLATTRLPTLNVEQERTMNRRSFVKGTTAFATGITFVPRQVLGGQGYTAPSDELTKAI